MVLRVLIGENPYKEPKVPRTSIPTQTDPNLVKIKMEFGSNLI